MFKRIEVVFFFLELGLYRFFKMWISILEGKDYKLLWMVRLYSIMDVFVDKYS